MYKRQIIVPHRFKDEQAEKEAHDKQGSYCVEFNTFVKDKNGYEALNWWAERCLEWCFYAVPGTTEWLSLIHIYGIHKKAVLPTRTIMGSKTGSGDQFRRDSPWLRPMKTTNPRKI